MPRFTGYISLLSSIVRVAAGILLVVNFTACSGALEEMRHVPNVADETAMLGISGSVTISQIQGNPSAIRALSVKSNKADNAASGKSGVECTVHTFSGKTFGPAATDDDGKFTIGVKTDEMAELTEEDVVLTAGNGMQLYKTVDFEATTTNIDLGLADVNTTLAVQDLTAAIPGFSGWGEDYQDIAGDVDMGCLYKLHHAVWNASDDDDKGLGEAHADLKEGFAATFSASGNAGALTNFLYSKDGSNKSDVKTEDDLSAHEAVNFVIDLFMESPEANDLCAGVKSGEVEADAFVAPLLASEDEAELIEVFSDATNLSVLGNLAASCVGQECSLMEENAAVVVAFIKNNGDDFADSAADVEIATLAQTVFQGMSCCGDNDDCQEILADAVNNNNNDDVCGEEKVTICHIPPGNPDNAHTIHVDDSAVPAHLDHGDTFGECPEPIADPAPLPFDSGTGTSDTETAPDAIAMPEGPIAMVDVVDQEIIIDDGGTTDETAEEVAEITPTPDPVTAEIVPQLQMDIAETAGEETVAETVVADEIVTEEEAIPDFYAAADAATAAAETTEPFATEVTPAVVEEEPVVQGLSKIWSYAFGHIYGGFYRMIPGPSAAIGELRPDRPGLEIATGNEEYYPIGYNYGDPLGRWFMFQANGAVEFWKNTENDEAHSSVNLFDVNLDGRLDMLGGTTSGNQVQAFDADAKWIWKHILNGHSISTPAVGMVGGKAKVFSGSMDGVIRSIDAKTGTLDWSFPAGKWVWSSASVADLDGDGDEEVVITSDADYVYNGYGVLYCFDSATGKVIWQNNLHKKSRASPAVADVDGDGAMEVLIGDGSGIFKAYDGKTGAIEWSYATGGEINSSPAVGDIDGDGDLETVFGSADGKVYALNGDGSLFWSAPLGAAVHSSPALAQRGTANRLDVYATTMGGKLVLLYGMNGSVMAEVSVGSPIVSSPTVGDVDGDGKLEIFFQDRKGDTNGMKGDTFWAVRDDGSLVAPFAREWPMFRANAGHTGVYGE